MWHGGAWCSGQSGVDRRKEEGEAAVCVWRGVAAPPVPNSRLVQAGTEEVLAEGHIPASERLRLGMWQARRGATPAVECGRLVAAHGVQRVTVGPRGRRTAKGVKVWCECVWCDRLG